MSEVASIDSGEQGQPAGLAARPPSDRAVAWCDRGTLGLVALIVVLAALFAASNAPVLNARFGPGHDGTNGSVWGSGSRAMRVDGLVESRFGGRRGLGDEYANHPPGILAETYVAESIAGEHRIVTRSPAWIGSIVSIALLAWLLVDAGFRRGAVAAAVVMATTTQLFLVYGSMLDTPVTSLPFSLAVLIVAQRVVQNRGPRPWVLLVVAMLAVCSGWQSTTMLAFAGIWVFAGAKGDRQRLSNGGWMAGGGLLGLTVTLFWVRWVYGSLSRLTDQQDRRTSGLGLTQSLSQQWIYLVDLIPYVGAIGLVGLAVALNPRSRSRALALVTAGSVIAYGLYFKQGAYIHDYWNYAILIPLAVGIAALAEAATPLIERIHVVRPALVGVVLVGIVAVLSMVTPSNSGATRESAVQTSPLVGTAVAMEPEVGPVLGLIPPLGSAIAPWAFYETGRPPFDLAVVDGKISGPSGRADLPVLVWLDYVDPAERHALRKAAIAKSGDWVLVSAASLVDLFGSSTPA